MQNFKLLPGVNHCSNREYHSDKSYLSSSLLKTLNEDPSKFYKEVILGQSERVHRAVYDLGSLTHSMLLEPHLVDEEFAFFKGWRKAGKDWDAFLDDEANHGKIYISAPQLEQAKAFVEAAKARPEFIHMLQGGHAELSICTTMMDVAVKMRADYINIDKGYIFDVKTTGYVADIEIFKQTIADFQYDLSGALYCMIAELHYGKPFDFYFGVISKPDLQADVYKMSKKSMEFGREKVKAALETYKKCIATGLWAPHADLDEATTDDNSSMPYEIKEV